MNYPKWLEKSTVSKEEYERRIKYAEKFFAKLEPLSISLIAQCLGIEKNTVFFYKSGRRKIPKRYENRIMEKMFLRYYHDSRAWNIALRKLDAEKHRELIEAIKNKGGKK